MNECKCEHDGREHQGFWGRCLIPECECLQYIENEGAKPWQMF